MKIVTAAEMREIDRLTTEKYGIPSRSLMENAGSAVARHVLDRYPAAKDIAVVCGKGNNGGDGLRAARVLHEAGKDVRVLLLSHPAALPGDAGAMFAELGLEPFVATTDNEIRDFDIERSDLIIDAILGTGFRPPLQSLAESAIRAMNATKATIVAVDIPSGAEADAKKSSALHARAHSIVTFTALKFAHVFQFAGISTVVRQIGSPAEIVRSAQQLNAITPEDFPVVLKPRERDSNKGKFGHVLVLGGSIGKAGAPAMAGMAALRVGAGLATVAAPKSILPIVASFAPEMMTIPLEETVTGGLSMLNLQRMRALTEGKRAIAVGPGAGPDDETRQFLRAVVERCELPVILDADGLNAFAGHVEQLTSIRHPLILTPHPGEMSRLTGRTIDEIQANRTEVARSFSKEHRCYLVLKGENTVIGTPEGEIWINTTGNPGMAKGGTGDILTGMIAGLVAQFPNDLVQAVIAGVYLHGLAGDIASDLYGEKSMLATEILKCFAAAVRQVSG